MVKNSGSEVTETWFCDLTLTLPTPTIQLSSSIFETNILGSEKISVLDTSVLDTKISVR